VRAIGLEIVPEIAEEAERRAKTAGLDKRVEVRCLDARALVERDPFDAAFWAQEFSMWQHAPKYLQRFLARYALEGCPCWRNFFPTPPRPGRYHSARAWTVSSTVASAPATAPLRRRSCRKRRPRESPTSEPPRPPLGRIVLVGYLERR
jgi:hypothetical protein